MDALTADPSRAKRLRPRDWDRLDRGLRAPTRRDRLGQVHRHERDRRRPSLVLVLCSSCGEPLGEVRPGTAVLCRRCRVWSGSEGERQVRA